MRASNRFSGFVQPRVRALLRLVCIAGAPMCLLVSCAAPIIVATAGLTAVQAGTSAYIRGVLEAAERGSLDELWQATTRMLDTLRFRVIQADRYPQSCYFACKTDNGLTITVRLEQFSTEVTHVEIRVGFFGDQSLSLLILESIRAEMSSIRGGPGAHAAP